MLPLSRPRGPGVFGPRGDFFPLTTGYGQDNSAAALRLTPLVTLIADWADTATA